MGTDVSEESATYIFGVVISSVPFKMETQTGSSQALLLIYQTVRRYIPDNINLSI
jgi:hypothetical protein